ncbi:MAG: sensor histidine kinase [Mogibacterium sp.]|nr:sensor histidine kinase [Mogibacterium sp.]
MNREAATVLFNLIILMIHMTPIFVCLKPKHASHENIAAVSVYVWVLMISAQALFRIPDSMFIIFQGVFSALFFLILLVFFEGSLHLKTFLYFSAWFFEALFTSLNIFFGYALRAQGILSREHINLILAIAVLILYYFLVKYYLKEKILRLFEQLSSRSSALIMLMPILFLILIYLGRRTVFQEERIIEEGAPVMLFYLFFCAMMFIVYSLAVGDTQRAINERTNAEQLRAARQIIELKKKNYNQIQEYQKRIRIIKHDFSHHVHALQHMSDEERKAYLDDLRVELEEGSELILCDNPAINSLLQEFTGRAKAEDVDFTANIALEKNLPVDSLTLCVILGNLLENALDACRKCAKDRFVRLQMMSEGESLRIMLVNRYNGDVRRRGNFLLSTKKNGGLGMLSIQRLLDNSKDDFDYYYDEDTFTSMLYLAKR